MSEEFELKGKVVIDSSQLDNLPARASQAVNNTRQRLAQVGGSGSALTQRIAQQASAAAAASPGAATNQALATALGRRFAANTGAALTPATGAALAAAAAQATPLGNALAAAARVRAGAAPPPPPGGRGGGRRPPRFQQPVPPPPRQPPGTRQPPSSSSISGGLGGGLFRGLATTFSQGTGINIPFLSLSPTFIAGAAAASAFSLAIKAAFSNTIELGHEVSALRVAMGGLGTTVAHTAAVAQNSNVPISSLTKAVGAMEQTATKDPASFLRLGISLSDATGRAKPLSAVLDEARSKISAIKDPAVQASAAMSLFGDNYIGILPFLRQTDQQLAAGAPGIAKQAAQIAKVQQETAKWDTNTAKLGTTLSKVGQSLATPFITAVNAIADSSVWQTGRLFNGGAPPAPPAQGLQPGEAVKGPDINLLKEYASTGISAFQEMLSLDQSLRDIDQSRAQIQFQIASSEISLANMQFDQQQALANQAEDRAMQLAEQIAALTISLNEFRAAEQSAAIRAREQEKSFFAFRPDNALVRADQERRYERDRAQEIARNARTNALAERNLANQKQIAEFDKQRLADQQAVVDEQKAVFVLTHEDVKTQSQTAVTQLAAALLNLKNAGKGLNPDKFDVTFNFPPTGNAAIDAFFAQFFSGITTDAISIIRGQGNRGDRVGRVGGNQAP